jgi:hypothetical protein
MADTIIYGGSVSGVWDLAGSPYLIQGPIEIDVGDSLMIEPGVEVFFWNTQTLTVYGSIQALGTYQDSILIAGNPSYSSWCGIDILNATDTCKFAYCTIEDVYNSTAPTGGALECEYSILEVSHCLFQDNHAMWGAAIRLSFTDATIEYSNFIDNNGYEGSCINVFWCSPVIRHCGFYDNTGNFG